MNCSQCGESCICPAESIPQFLSSSAEIFVSPSEPTPTSAGAEENLCCHPIPNLDSAANAPQVSVEPAWRDEVSARLNRYRSRRKPRPPRYPSLTLPFDLLSLSAPANATGGSPRPVFETVSNHALALDGMQQVVPATEESAAGLDPRLLPEAEGETESGPIPNPGPIRSTQPRSAYVSAKIIEFPGISWGPPVLPPHQLAEPVRGRPRILEVPEAAPPAPALGGITIDAANPPEEANSGAETLHQTAPLALRLLAAAIDGMIVAAAAALFGFIFWKVTAFRPPLLQLLSLAAAIPALFWAAYQYLMIVYAATTPGLRLVRIELSRFDGSPTTRAIRRWRVLASWLSAVSAGMGYAWVLLDQSALCWHDRITHTYLAQKKCGDAVRNSP